MDTFPQQILFDKTPWELHRQFWDGMWSNADKVIQPKLKELRRGEAFKGFVTSHPNLFKYCPTRLVNLARMIYVEHRIPRLHFVFSFTVKYPDPHRVFNLQM